MKFQPDVFDSPRGSAGLSAAARRRGITASTVFSAMMTSRRVPIILGLLIVVLVGIPVTATTQSTAPPVNPSKFVAARRAPASADADPVTLAKAATAVKELVPRLGDVVPAALKNESRCRTCKRPLTLIIDRDANIDEQPFTRDESLWIPRDIHTVVVEGHDTVHGFGSAAVTVDRSTTSGPNVRPRAR